VTPASPHANVVVRTAADDVVLIRRVRKGRVYYVVPGVPVAEGETPGAAARRAAAEVLGIDVVIGTMLYAQEHSGVDHFFFLATTSDSELRPCAALHLPDYDDFALEGTRAGSYEIVQLPRKAVLACDIRPLALARRLAREP